MSRNLDSVRYLYNDEAGDPTYVARVAADESLRLDCERMRSVKDALDSQPRANPPVQIVDAVVSDAMRLHPGIRRAQDRVAIPSRFGGRRRVGAWSAAVAMVAVAVMSVWLVANRSVELVPSQLGPVVAMTPEVPTLPYESSPEGMPAIVPEDLYASVTEVEDPSAPLASATPQRRSVPVSTDTPPAGQSASSADARIEPIQPASPRMDGFQLASAAPSWSDDQDLRVLYLRMQAIGDAGDLEWDEPPVALGAPVERSSAPRVGLDRRSPPVRGFMRVRME